MSRRAPRLGFAWRVAFVWVAGVALPACVNEAVLAQDRDVLNRDDATADSSVDTVDVDVRDGDHDRDAKDDIVDVSSGQDGQIDDNGGSGDDAMSGE